MNNKIGPKLAHCEVWCGLPGVKKKTKKKKIIKKKKKKKKLIKWKKNYNTNLTLKFFVR